MSDTLAKALVEVQKKLPAVPKNATATVQTKTGGSYSYAYVTLDSLIAKTLPVLNEHGLAIMQAPEYIPGFGLGLRTTLTHEAGESMTSVMPILHPGGSMQDLGGAITYARRYAWSAVLGISGEHDDDANAITQIPAAAKPAFAPPASAPQPKPPAPAPASESNPDAYQGDDPGLVRVHFGKNAGIALKDLAPKQRQFYAESWNPDTSKFPLKPQDGELRRAARILCGLQPLEIEGPFAATASAPATDDSDIPF